VRGDVEAKLSNPLFFLAFGINKPCYHKPVSLGLLDILKSTLLPQKKQP
jgi:hypothetical protein